MNSIQIKINSRLSNIEIYIDILKQTIIINDKEKRITENQIDNLIRIIRNWKNEYSNEILIDNESFFIKINNNNGYEVIKGIGEYPNNYISLKEWISDFDE